jgi:hypothetical protein
MCFNGSMEWVIGSYLVTWVDAVLILVAILYAWQAYERGIVAVLCEFTAWLIAWMVGLLIFPLLASVLASALGLIKMESLEWGILLSVVIVQILAYRLLTILAKKLPRHFFGSVIQMVAVIPAMFNGIFFALFILLTLIALPFWFPLKDELLASQTAQYLLVARSLFGSL